LPLLGGDIENFAAFEAEASRDAPPDVATASLHSLLRNHGTDYRAVLREHGNSTVTTVPGTRTLTAEIRYAVNQEMAVHLDDVIMRRTDLAAGSHPGRAALLATAAEMGRQLSWSAERLHRELAAVEQNLRRHLARDPNPDVASSDAPGNRTAPALDGASRPASVPSVDGAMLAESNLRASA
jgi:glycerol-3-phosphate dehydrogenase